MANTTRYGRRNVTLRFSASAVESKDWTQCEKKEETCAVNSYIVGLVVTDLSTGTKAFSASPASAAAACAVVNSC